jgi:hypothetical protein
MYLASLVERLTASDEQKLTFRSPLDPIRSPRRIPREKWLLELHLYSRRIDFNSRDLNGLH